MQTRTLLASLGALCALMTASHGLPSDGCRACQATVGNIKGKVTRHMRQHSVEWIPDALCSSAPAGQRDDCYSLAAHHVTDIGRQLAGLDGGALCEALGQCPEPVYMDRVDQPVSQMALEEPTVGNGFLCGICKTSLSIVHKYLEDRNNRKAILDMLKAGCRFLPIASRECSLMVDRYGLAVMLIGRYLSPHRCVAFGVCTKGEQMAEAGELCRPCELGAGVIEDFIRNPNTEGELKALAIDVCSQMSESTDKSCELGVAEYLPSLLQHLQSVEYQEICATLLACGDEYIDIDDDVIEV